MRKIKLKSFITPTVIALVLFVVCMFTSGGFFGDVWYGSAETDTESGTDIGSDIDSDDSDIESDSEDSESGSVESEDGAETDKDSSFENKEEDQVAKVITAFANCFTVPGLFLVGVAAIGWIASFGTFDMLAYGTRTLFATFIKPMAEKLPKTYYDYRAEKNEKGRSWSVETLIVGCAFFAVGMIFVIISLVI